MVVLLLGPQRDAISGVSTHLNLIFASRLAHDFRLKHFQVGREGRGEGLLRRISRLLFSPFALAVRILSERVDVVHINTSMNRRAYWRDLIHLVVARLMGARVVYQVHGGALPQQFCRDNRILGMFLRATLRLPQAIVVLAQSEIAAYRRFLHGQSIIVLPNAIDAHAYAGSPRTHPRCIVPLQLLYVGRLCREKGLYESLRGLQLALAQGVKATLVIAGSGPEQVGLEALATELKLGEHIRFAGPVFGDRKIKLMQEAHAFLFPTYAEGLPYALLETMAAGLPSITTPVGAIPDVVVDGVHGMFVMPRDAAAIGHAIVKLAANPSALERMSVACRERITTRYSLDRLAAEFSALYADVGNRSSERVVTEL